MEGITVYQCRSEQCLPYKTPENMIIPVHILHFIIKGKGFFNGVELSANKAFLCRQGTVNCWYPVPEDPWTYYWFNVDGTLADKLIGECFSCSDVLDFDSSDELIRLLGMAADICRPDFQAGIFIALLGLIKPSEHHEGVSAPQYHVAAAERLIYSTGGKITPAQIAAELGLSRAYLYNIFKKLRRCSVCDTVIKYRMTRAAELLVETNHPISLIASAVGYEDQFSFSKLFKAKFGCSPSNYRSNANRAAYDPFKRGFTPQ